jgi:hypothetical protein
MDRERQEVSEDIAERRERTARLHDLAASLGDELENANRQVLLLVG